MTKIIEVNSKVINIYTDSQTVNLLSFSIPLHNFLFLFLSLFPSFILPSFLPLTFPFFLPFSFFPPSYHYFLSLSSFLPSTQLHKTETPKRSSLLSEAGLSWLPCRFHPAEFTIIPWLGSTGFMRLKQMLSCILGSHIFPGGSFQANMG